MFYEGAGQALGFAQIVVGVETFFAQGVQGAAADFEGGFDRGVGGRLGAHRAFFEDIVVLLLGGDGLAGVGVVVENRAETDVLQQIFSKMRSTGRGGWASASCLTA